MGLTNEKSLIEINKLFDLCFEANSLMDRMAYVLSIKFNAIEFANWIHHEIAHKLVGDDFADGIEAFGELRGDLFYRGMLPEQKQDYETISEAMKSFVSKIAEIERQNIIAIKSCIETGDFSFEDFLRNFGVNSIAPMLKQATVFYKMAVEYEGNDNAYKINRDFSSFILPDFKGGN